MLSEQAKQAIEFSRKYIKSGQASLTPEIALAARKGADEGNKYDLPEEVTLKAA